MSLISLLSSPKNRSMQASGEWVSPPSPPIRQLSPSEAVRSTGTLFDGIQPCRPVKGGPFLSVPCFPGPSMFGTRRREGAKKHGERTRLDVRDRIRHEPAQRGGVERRKTVS
jgi:hypothetical protein